MLKLKAARKNGKILAVVAAAHLVVSSMIPSSPSRTYASDGAKPKQGAKTTQEEHDEHEHEHEHEEIGVPGDDEIVEILHVVGRMTDTKDPAWAFLVTSAFTLLSVHQLLHSLHEARMLRRELKMELEHGEHDQHKAHKKKDELKGIELKIASMEKSVTQKEFEFKSTLEQLREKGKSLKGDSRSQFDMVLEKMETGLKSDGSSFRPVLLVDQWLKSPAGQAALKNRAIAKWAAQYGAARDGMKNEQLKFFGLLDQADRHSNLGGPGRNYLPTNLGEPGASVGVHDVYGRPTDNLTRQQAVVGIGSEAAQCAADYKKLANHRALQANQLSFRNFYGSRLHMAGVKFDLATAGTFALAALGSYAHYRGKTGVDAFHAELARKQRFELDWKSQSDLLTQLSSKEGQKEMGPFYDAVYELVNSPKYANRIKDEAGNSLTKLKMGNLAHEAYKARLENKDKVDVATMIDLANASRTVGAMALTRKQLQAILSTNSKVEPQFRELFLQAFVSELPGLVYPALGGQEVLSAGLKQEIIADLEIKLEDMTERGAFKIDPNTVIPFPGKSLAKHGEGHPAHEDRPVAKAVAAKEHAKAGHR
jgi:hypothetical protein